MRGTMSFLLICDWGWKKQNLKVKKNVSLNVCIILCARLKLTILMQLVMDLFCQLFHVFRTNIVH